MKWLIGQGVTTTNKWRQFGNERSCFLGTTIKKK